MLNDFGAKTKKCFIGDFPETGSNPHFYFATFV